MIISALISLASGETIKPIFVSMSKSMSFNASLLRGDRHFELLTRTHFLVSAVFFNVSHIT